MKRITLATLIVLIMITSSLSYLSLLSANPIPVPTLILEKEDITIHVKATNMDLLLVSVDGFYPFKNVNYKNITMYFPIPPEACKGNITVTMNGKPVKWTIVNKGRIITSKGEREFKYETIRGVYPLLSWSIENPPKNFVINVKYTYYVKREGNEYYILYAMGTGRYSLYYSKKCTAYVKLILEGLAKSKLKISLVPPPTIGLGKTEFLYTISSNREIINIVKESRMFHGLERDLLLVISRAGETSMNSKWIPSEPYKIELSANTTREDNTIRLSIDLTMIFRHGGFRVEWGTVEVDDYTINIYTEVWEWTGPAIQVITPKKHTYTLTGLDPGTYTIIVYVNGKPKKISKITIHLTNNTVTSSISNSNNRIISTVKKTITTLVTSTHTLFKTVAKEVTLYKTITVTETITTKTSSNNILSTILLPLLVIVTVLASIVILKK